MFDVFYIGKKPNLFAHEKPAESIQDACRQSRTRFLWIVNYLSDYTGFDFLWEPPPWQSHQRHSWASQWQKDSGTYLVPKQFYSETNYHVSPVIKRLPDPEAWDWPAHQLESWDTSWHPDFTEPDMTYQFGTQHQPTGGPRYRGGSTLKYMSVPRAIKTSVDSCWQIPDNINLDEFDWTWHPDDRDPPYIYQFGTQHQRTGGPQYVVPGSTDVKYVDQIRSKSQPVATAIIEIDHLDGNAGQIANTTKTSRYFDNYLDTLKRIAKNIGMEHEFVWICSSICDYTGFDFSWHPEQWQATMLHVFASDGEKFGDTFFMHVPTFQYRADTCQLLEWYDVNFVDIDVPRRPIPEIKHKLDSQVDAIKQYNWRGPLALFVAQEESIDQSILPTVPLWREKTKTIIPCSPDARIAIVPNISIPYIKTQVYDYPHIDKSHRHLVNGQLQDIVFISYDEPQADTNWKELKSKFPRAIRVHGVQGMENALKAAAEVSKTPWYFAVFAKTELADTFKFDHVPDYFQTAKHYIFDCKNMLNGLTYGHMGIILYNCRMILESASYEDLGLDYTLSFPHEVVPELSCYGHFNSTPYHTWRTAFRETSKLAYFNYLTSDVDNEYRLNIWKTKAQGDYAEWCLRGAKDGIDFFQETQGNLTLMKQSFRWEWLRQRFVNLYGKQN